MAIFFGKPSINDHLDDLIGSWFGNTGIRSVRDHGSKPPHDDGQDGGSSWPDHTPPSHDDGHDFPPVGDVIKFWLHKVFGGHHHNPPPDGNDAPQIIDGEQTGQIPEGDSTELLTVAGAIRFTDKDFGDTHTATVEFVSTTDPSGMEYGALEAVINPNFAEGAAASSWGIPCPTPTQAAVWTYAVNDADLQQLAEGQEILQTYRVTVTDAAGEADSQLVTIRLQGNNDAPTASAIALVVDANAPAELPAVSLVRGPLAGTAFVGDDVDSDDNPGTLTYELLGQPSGGTVTNNNDGTFSFDPGHDFDDLAEGETRDVTVSYHAIDSHGAISNEATITITVRGVGGAEPIPPVANPDSNPTDAVVEAGFDEITGAAVGDATATGNALDNDTGQGLSVVAVGAGLAVPPSNSGVGTEIDGTYGKLTLGTDGQWTYQLDDLRAATDALAPGQVAHDVFSYTIIDENGETSTTTLILAITGSADAAAPIPPRAVADINVDDAVVEAGFEPDGTPIPGDATAQGNALANDEGQGLEVVGVAAGPLGAAPGVGVGDTIQGTYGTLMLRADGGWDYALDDANPATEALGQGQQATDVFSYTIQDPSGQTSTAQLFVVISGSNDEVIVVNHPPTATPDTNDGDPVIEAGIDANGDPNPGDPTASGNVLANDSDPDPGDVLTVAGIVFGVATDNQTGGIPTDPIDGTYGTLSINAQGEWTYSLDNSRAATEALAQGQQATEVFTYTVRDVAGELSTTTLSIVVTGTDDATPNQDPVAVDDDVVATSATDPLIINVLENDSDPDGDPLSIVATSIVLPAGVIGGAIDANGDGVLDAIQLRPTAGDTFPESFEVQYTISDGKGGTDTATVHVNVEVPNQDPIAVDDTFTAPAGATTLTIDVLGNDSDPDGDPLSIVPDSIMLPAGVTGGAIDTNGDGFLDAVELTPAPGETFPDSFQFQYTVSDGKGGMDTATVSVTVPSANMAPDAVDDVVAATSATDPLTINVLDNDSDPDGDPLSIVASSIVLPAGVTGGAIDTNGDGVLDAIQLQPVAGETFPAAFEFQYTVSDGKGGFDTATVSVTTPNTPPVANDDPVETGENAALEIRLADLIANDTDANRDALTVTAINGVALDAVAEGGTIALTSGATLVRTSETTFDYVPGTVFDSLGADDTATDQFSYAISDGRGGESSAIVTVTINGENDAPVAVADTATAASPGPQTLLYFAATGNFLETGGGRELYAFNPDTGELKLVADVNSVDSRGSDPQELTPLDGKLYFVAHGNSADGDVGYELFVFNPATNETKLVADLMPGSDDSFPSELTVIDGKLYFQATSPDAGSELYVLDPATDEATLVDVNQGPDGSYPSGFTGLDGKVYFFADDGTTGQELRVLDPSTGDVSLVADLNEGPGSANASGLMEIGGKLYFAARDNAATGADFGVELFVYDPTSGDAPMRVTDVSAGSGNSYPADFTEISGQIYFTATGPDGRGLYVYDPTGNTTTPVPEETAGIPLTFPSYLTVLNGQLYFAAEATDPDTLETTVELYVYDPVAGTTTLIPGPSDASGGSMPENLTVLDGRIFFTAEGNNATDGDVGRELYAYDPGTGDVTLIADLNLGNSDGSLKLALVGDTPSAGSSATELTVVDGKLYFSAIGNNDTDGNVGRELYVYDPATDTTTLAADVSTDPAVPRIKGVESAVIGTNIYFVSPGDNATDGNVGIEVYVLDTLTNETKPLIDLVPGPGNSNPTDLTVIDGKLYFSATTTSSASDLYVHDPVTLTTTLLTNPDAMPEGANPRDFIGAGGKVYFTAEATDGTDSLGRELFVYDPTGGTPPALVADLNLGAGSSSPQDLTVIGDKLYFTANYNDGTDSAGRELFALDPAGGAPVLIDVNTGTGSSNPAQLTEFDGKIYFAADGVDDNGDSVGRELYVLDPTTNEATLVADLQVGTGSSSPQEFTVVDGKLYFTAIANDGTPEGNVGNELYVIDPTVGPAPTLVADLKTGSGSSSPSFLTALGDKLYFGASGPDGNELYVIDPAVGPDPVLAADLSVSGSSFPSDLMVLDGRLYFTAEGDDGTNSTGIELYVVDPDTGQVDLVPEAYAGDGSSSPSQITAFNGKVYFTADGNNPTDGDVGRELYVYDPIAKTTTLVADLNIAQVSSGSIDKIAAAAIAAPSTSASSNPTALTVVDGKLYFTASAYNETDGLVGQAIYVIDPSVSETPMLVANVDARSTGSSSPEFLTELTADGLPKASGNVLANDTDVDTGDTLTVVGVQAGAETDALSGNVGTEIDGRYGTLVLNTDGSWTYVQDFGAPSTGNPGEDVFSYTIRDASGSTSTTTLTIAVVPGSDENRAPVATGEATDISQDDVLTFKLSDLLANDRDPNGDTLTVTKIGKIDLADFPPGSVLTDDGLTLTRVDDDTFVLDLHGSLNSLAEGESQTGHLDYTISDGKGGTATAVFDITVHGRNDAPVAAADTASVIPFIYFSADSTVLDGTSGRQLYAYDRSTGTTTLVSDVNDIDRGGSSPESITNFAGKVYFVANGNNPTDGDVGQELYVFNPTTGETKLVADLWPGPDGSEPRDLTVLDGKLYFVADSNAGVIQIYSIDTLSDSPTLVTSLDPGSSISELTPFNGLLYFAGSDAADGSELRVLDPATGQITVAADVNSAGESSPSGLTVIDGNLYFSANGDSGRELYVLDASVPEGARVIADLNTGSSNPQELTLVDGKIYFAATGNNTTDGDVGQELYVYDPIAGTTTLAEDIITGPESSSPRQLTAVGSELYFLADTHDENDNLVTAMFVYDAASGKVIQIPSTEPNGSGAPDELTALDGKLYFSAYGTNTAGDEVGRELYVYDPANRTTTLIADLNQGNGSSISKLALVGGSSGANADPGDLTVIDGKLYFSAEGNNPTDGGVGREAYVYDPTTGIVSLVSDVRTDPAVPRGSSSGGPVVIDGHIYFTADVVNATDGNLGQELYVVDSTTDTGMAVTDLATGPANSTPSELTVIDGKLYFSAEGNNATDGNVGRELYVYDPASGEATLIADLAAGEEGSDPSSITALAGKVYFVAYGNNTTDGEVGEELYVHDPVTGQTKLAADIFAGVDGSSPDQLTVAGGKLYFVAYGNDGTDDIGRELYVLDPTTDEASLVADLNEGGGSSYPEIVAVIDDKLYFVAEANNTKDGNVGGELYVLDPTTDVPTLVADLNEGGAGSYPRDLTAFDDKIYFVAYGDNTTDGAVGTELYVYNPADGKTTLVSDLYAGINGSNPGDLTVLDGKLYFAATATDGMGVNIGRELFVIDPNAGGDPALVADLSTDPGGAVPDELTVLDGKLYFAAYGNNATDGDVGRELYVLDPSNGEITLLPEAYTGSGSSNPHELTVLDGKLYFAATGNNATDGNVGEEFYVYDPATGKTTLVADLNTLIAASGGGAAEAQIAAAGPSTTSTSSAPSNLTVVDGKLYFTAFGANDVDGIVGPEVYVYDPATGETSLVADISTRTLGSSPSDFTLAGGGTPLNGNVLSNDTDVDHGDSLMVVGVQAGDSGDPVSGNLDQTIAGLYGTLVLHADGSWTYNQDLGAPQASDPQIDVFTYTIADKAGATSTTTLSITAQPSPDTAPVANDDAITVSENDLITIRLSDLLANDSGDTLTVTHLGGIDLESFPTGSVLNIAGLTYTRTDDDTITIDTGRFFDPLGPNDAQVSETPYVISDGRGGTATGTITLTINGVNDAPTGQPTITGVAETGTELTANPTFDDPEGVPADDVAWQWQALNGTDWVDIQGAMNQTYAPSTADVGLQLRVVGTYTDGGGTKEMVTSDATEAVSGGATNEAPTVSLVSALTSLPEDTDTSASSVKIADIVIMDDGVGDNQLSLTGDDASLFEIVQTTNGPELHLREGAVLSAQSNPSLDVNVVVDDPALGTGPEDTAPLNIKVLPVTNLAPFADDDFGSGQPGEAIIINVLDGDFDRDGSIDPGSVQIEGADTGSNGKLLTVAGEGTWAVVASTGQIMFTPEDPGLTGPVTAISYTVADNEGLRSNPATVSVTISDSGTNEAPTVSVRSALTSLPEDTDTSAASVKVADIVIMDDGVGDNQLSLTGVDASLFEIVQTTNGPELHLREGAVLSAQDNPSLDVTVVVDDPALGTGPEDSAPLNIRVLPATNLAPFADDDFASGQPGEAIIINVLDGDFDTDGTIDPGSVQIEGADTGSNGKILTVAGEGTWAVGATTGQISFTPEDGFTGPVTAISYTVADNEGLRSNLARVIVTIDSGGGSEAPVIGGIDKAPLAFTENDQATAVANGIMVSDDGVLVGATIAISAYVAGEDLLALASPPTGISAVFDDQLGVLTLSGAATAAEYQEALQAVTYQNVSDNPSVDTHTITFSVDDGVNPSVTASRDVVITPVNDAPAGQPAVSGDPAIGEVLTADVSGIADADGIPDLDGSGSPSPGDFSFQWESSVDGTAWAAIPDATAATFTPDIAQEGQFVRVVASYTDGQGFHESLTSDATAQVPGQGGGANVDPVAQDDTAVTTSGVAVGIDVLANDSDPDGDPLTITDAPDGANGRVDIGDFNSDGIPDLLYTPFPGFTGVDTFSYAIDDGNGGTDTGTVNVVVAQEVASTPDTQTLEGHVGPDRFVYHLGDGPVTITNFEPGTPGQNEIIDQIEISGVPGLNFSTLDSNQDGVLDPMDGAITGDQSGITIHLGTDDALTVANVSELHDDDLLFS